MAIPSDTRTALLDSAERAARTRGFDGFSFADLATDVGIRKASIHYHFPSKADLAIALMQRYYDTLQQSCAEINAAHTTGAGRLTAIIENYRNALDGGKSMCLCVSFSSSRESLAPRVIAQIRQFRLMMLAWLEAAFELGRQDGTIQIGAAPHLESAALLPLLEGAQLTARAEENPALFEVALSLFLARLT